MRILAIESSCDETAAAVVDDGISVVRSVVATSHEMHEKYGGIVPEVAARMQLESVIPVITEALSPLRKRDGDALTQIITESVDAIAVTMGPGLIGSLLIGVETAKTISYVTGKPIIPVNHVVAHMYANFIRPEAGPIRFPAISLVVSGGHTELYLMENERVLTWLGGTLDDAAGECFDKAARLLGFGNGGGVAVQEAASRMEHPGMIRLPRPLLPGKNEYNFSFSGLKTAILRAVTALKKENGFSEETVSQLSYEVQEAITDVLVKKTLRAAEAHGVRTVLLSGGVSANVRLREKFNAVPGITVHAPPFALCTDNAVYIASYAFFRGKPAPWQDITAVPDLSVEISS